MVRRGKETVIPTGNTVVYEGDVLVQAKFDKSYSSTVTEKRAGRLTNVIKLI